MSECVKTIAVACDHGAFDLKQVIMEHLREAGYEVTDFGCYEKASMDYPDVAFPMAEAVAAGKFDRGIVMCTTGIGVSICCNKVRGIRCALCTSEFAARMTRKHNDTNILAMGAEIISVEEALKITDIWLTTAFDGIQPDQARHLRRVNKIVDYENRF